MNLEDLPQEEQDNIGCNGTISNGSLWTIECSIRDKCKRYSI